jgi:hypothetical protein
MIVNHVLQVKGLLDASKVQFYYIDGDALSRPAKGLVFCRMHVKIVFIIGIFQTSTRCYKGSSGRELVAC